MSRRAFTLMEMILVMAIIGLVFAGTIVGISALRDERSLQKPYIDLRGLAKTAWQRSMMEQRAWQISFYADKFQIEPRRAVDARDADVFHKSDVAKGRGSGVESYPIPDGMMVEVRHWASRDWYRPTNEKPAAWIFEQSGLCEPISVRFTSDQGTVGAQFDPLTASVKEEIFDRNGE